MMKKIAVLFAAICLLLTGCSQNAKKQNLSLEMFTDSSGNYGFAELPFGKSISETEKLLGTTFENPQQTADEVTLCALQDFYEYNSYPVRASFEFRQDGLQQILFAIEPGSSEAEQVYADLSEELTDLYGQPDKTADNDEALSENSSPFTSQAVRWDSTADNFTSSLQLMMLTDEQDESTIIIGVGILE